MKVSLKWLQEYVDVVLPAADLAGRLTMAGSEVKGIQVTGGWENIVVGQITAINPHPDADRLRLTTIDLGSEQHTVVCGAPNLKRGDKVAFAHINAQLTDPHSGKLFRLKPAKIRGVTSDGMACSERELGISDNHEEIMILPDEAPLGMPLADYLGDSIFDLDITPNRPDCLSVIGIAREAAALTGQGLHIAEVEYEEAEASIDRQVSVEIDAPDLCPRYCASLIGGIRLAPSPPWLQQRLISYGIRPINNIVDITNYVMLEYGQPLHAFDYERLRGKKIIVRRADAGEVIVTLDDVERALSSDMLVIADEERAVAIAGVMGGANSEVTGVTGSVLLEAASFNPASIHHTGDALRLPSEARMRFERGISPELVLPALRRATQLISQLAGGKAAQGLIDVYPGERERLPIRLTTSMVERLLGVAFNLDRIVGALTSLGFDCEVTASEVRVTPPYWRSDINLAVDLIEEVARINGYDKIPATMLGQPLPHYNPEPVLDLKRRVRQSLTGYGFQEVITYSLTSLEKLGKLLPGIGEVRPTPLRMANPMTADQEYLRPNLRPNLLVALEANRRHESGGIKLFELGKVYLPRPDDLPGEPEVLCGILSGPRQERSWLGDSEPVDFFDARGVVEGLLNRIGIDADFKEGSDKGLHPRRQVSIVIAGSNAGIIGEVHSRVREAFEISEPVYLFEVDLAACLPFTASCKAFQPVPRFPAMVRDIALVVDSGVTHQRVRDIVKSFPLVARVEIFDVYAGEQVSEGKKSLAYRITFQSLTHTLTDEEVNNVQGKILDRLSSELGASLRS